MVSQKRTIVVILLVAACFVMVIAGSRQQGQKTEEATPIRPGVMTEKQKAHSKIYQGFGSGKKLRDLAAVMPSGVKVRRNTPLSVGESGTALTSSEFIRQLSCNADAVIVGTVREKSSQLTEDEGFIFTDYDLTITEVIKDNTRAHLIPDIELTVTQPGGKVQLGSTIIEAADASYKPLTLGKRYMFFLKFSPLTESYTPVNSTSTYELGDNKIDAQTEETISSWLSQETPALFLEKVRAGKDATCGKSERRNE